MVQDEEPANLLRANLLVQTSCHQSHEYSFVFLVDNRMHIAIGTNSKSKKIVLSKKKHIFLTMVYT